jgi:hypothetical protein
MSASVRNVRDPAVRMTHWSAVYSEEQRSAIERAYCELRIRPLARIVRMAAAGELSTQPGAEPLEPFTIPYSSARSIGQAAERRKLGRVSHELARKPPRDRAQTLQLRLTGVVDNELAYLERMQARKGRKALDWEQIRRAARALRELATVPDEMRLPREPGQPRRDGTTPEGATADSLAGRILAASDASMSPTTRARINTPETDTEAPRINVQHRERERNIEHDEREDDDDDAPRAPERASLDPHMALSAAPSVPAA